MSSQSNKHTSKERKHSDDSPTFFAENDPAAQIKEELENAAAEVDEEAPYGRLADGTPITRPRQRAPQFSADPESARGAYGDVHNPPPQFMQPGEEPISRREQVSRTGELDALQGMTLDDASKKIEDERAAFLYWQASQKKYYIYEFQSFDSKKGEDVWKPKPYEVYRLTTQQYKTILLANAKVQDLFLKRNMRDTEFLKGNPNEQIIEAQTEEMLIKCKLWFRMSEEEFKRSAFADIRDCCDAAQLAQAKVPSYRKVPTTGR
jgi:hypothetical protein